MRLKKIQVHLKRLDSRSYLNNQIIFFTQVLRPCSLVMENMMHVSGLQTVVVTIEELTIKVRSFEKQVCFLSCSLGFFLNLHIAI